MFAGHEQCKMGLHISFIIVNIDNIIMSKNLIISWIVSSFKYTNKLPISSELYIYQRIYNQAVSAQWLRLVALLLIYNLGMLPSEDCCVRLQRSHGRAQHWHLPVTTLLLPLILKWGLLGQVRIK